ncbi:CotH kinase family protein [Patescibacteria group bacterium]|nr:CotH kinase family protein [Patescibacteria group bacterium]
MEISDLPNLSTSSQPTHRRLFHRILLIGGAVIVAIILISALAVGVFFRQIGLVPNPIRLIQRYVPDYVTINPIQIAANYFSSFTAHPDQITLDIKYADYQRLAYKREQALALGVLVSSPDDVVPATVNYQGISSNAEVRLKGDFSDHWRDPYRWSFRVKIKSSAQPVRGMREFSLQLPGTRGYINEWVVQQMFDQAGLMGLRYDFVNLTVNGRSLGIYAIEEGFSKELVESDKQREGPIISFDDSTLLYFGLDLDSEELFTSNPIDSFQSNQINSDPTQLKFFLQAKDRLESFRRGELYTHQVFDVDKLATFLALSDLCGSDHNVGAPNMRYYYNPVTSLLEPIIFDVTVIVGQDQANFMAPLGLDHSPHSLASLKGSATMPLEYKDLLFADPQLFTAYLRELDRLSQPKWLDEFFAKIKSDYSQKLKLLHRTYPWYSFKSRGILAANQFYIRTLLHPTDPIQAYAPRFDRNARTLKMQVGNAQRFPVEILGVQHSSSKISVRLPDPVVLTPKSVYRAIDFLELIVPVGTNWTLPDPIDQGWEVEYRIYGLINSATVPVTPWEYLTENFVKNDFLSQPSNWQQFSFLSLNPSASNEIVIPSGNWQINHSLIIPAGFILKVAAGAHLNLTNAAVILSYSPIQLLGEGSNPVTISSDDHTGQGLVIINAPERSQIRHTIFKDLSLVEQENWQLTSAITFYQSSVDISDSQFLSNSSADDYLNIIRSDFTIERIMFSNTFADALDLDFSTGSISNATFMACGAENLNGDCLDLSGGIIELSNIQISSPGDKGISIGERAQIKADNISINGGNIGIASKDLSVGEINNLSISDSEVGVAVFIKKPEYGPARLTLKSVEFSNVTTSYIVEKRSWLSVNGKLIPASATNVAEMFYGNN